MVVISKAKTLTAARYLAILLMGIMLMGASCPKPGQPPVINALSPASGPSGTIVTVTGGRFSVGGTVYFDDNSVATQGTGSPLAFTIPYDAAVGNHDVHVRIKGQNSAKVTFQCTSTQNAANPAADAFEAGYYVLLNSSDENIIELAVFGTGFDTNCEVIFDGTAVNDSRLPGIPAGSILGIFVGGIMTFQNYPADRYGNTILALLKSNDGNLPALGSAHTVAVRNNITNTTSNTLNITIPSRRVLVEMDRIDTEDWPPQTIWRSNTINTLRKAYTNAGLLIDLRWDETITDPNAGAAFSIADIIDFFNTFSSMSGDVYAGEWYFHVGILSRFTMNNVLGIMWANDRRGLVVFADAAPTDANYLRTYIHEMGHGFNLTHCDGDAIPQRDDLGNLVFVNGRVQFETFGTTIMNQTSALANNWGFTFSNDSQTHLTTHPVNEVRPGAGNIEFNDPARTFGQCEY